MKKVLLALAAAGMVATPAMAHPVYNQYGQKLKHNHGKQYERNNQRYNDYRYQQRTYRYNESYRYDQPQRYWKDRSGRVYCQRRDGTVGIVVGGTAGILIGREIGRTEGAIIGGALGALLGREIARGQARCR